MQWSTERKIAGGFSLVLLILSIIGIASYSSTIQLVETANKVAHTHKILEELKDLLSDVKDVETGGRGYVITGEERYLEPYYAAIELVDQDIDQLRELIADDLSQQQRLQTLKPFIADRLAVAGETIDLRRNKGFKAALQLVLTDEGRRAMDNIRYVIHEMEDEENELLRRQSEKIKVSARNTTSVIGFGSLLAFALVPLAGFVINREVTERRRAEEALRRARDELETRITERTAGIVNANTALQTEITERKQAEEALRKSEERFQLIVRATNDAVWDWDLLTDAVWWNEGVQILFGYSADEVGSDATWWYEHIHPEDQERVVSSIHAVIAGGKSSWSDEYRYIRANGSYADVFDRGYVIHDHLGKPLRMLGGTMDISDRKQAEEALRKANDELEARVAERTAKLSSTNIELAQARDQALAATQAKGAFLANMSHEIRTPMNGVIGMTGLLLDTELTLQQQDFVETIRSSGDALLTIINDILDFSKIESDKLELEEQPFELRTCVEEALDLLAPEAAEKNLELAYLVNSQVPTKIMGDVTRLRQILVNLLGNAVKFTEVGEVVVSVTAQRKEEGGRPKAAIGEIEHDSDASSFEIQFAVQDTGIGIPQDRIDHLFKSFSQVDSSVSRKYGGTGLGLAISRRLSEMMGGRMWVESQVGCGSTFYFTMVAQSDPSLVSVNNYKIQPQLSGRRLLIVDDNATNRQILTLQSQSWGMLSRAAASGPEALSWINQGEEFDMAILDMQMPEMDGLTLAAEIRRQPSCKELPLVMLTSIGRSEAKVQVVEVKFAAFLNKPVKQSQLYNVLIQTLGGQPIRVRPQDRRQVGDTQRIPQLAEQFPLRILLAEDNVANQKIALLLLQRLGYRADMAANGLEVLQALRRQPYDVVLMDIQMPEMDGLAATRCIRQEWSQSQRPRVIAVTANAMQGDRETCLEAGMDDYISKPIRVEELVQALMQCQRLPNSPHFCPITKTHD